MTKPPLTAIVSNQERGQTCAWHLCNFDETGWRDDPETVAVDFLANLMHLCDTEGWEVSRIVAAATHHYEAEVLEEETHE